jgi:hypothetical protein
MAYTSQVCPRCWTPYRPGAKRCPRCGLELQREDDLSFIDLFGPPEVLRRYQIQDTLAHSRVGHVYKALDLETQTTCVIKELSGAALLDPLEAEQAAGRLRQRVRRLSGLAHPNLVPVHGLLSEGSRHFVIMDLIEGPTLKHVLEGRERPIPESLTLQWADRLCSALACLHDQDPPLLFPNLAARHVILSSESEPVLVDLGLTRLFEKGRQRDEGVAGDVAALAALLYHALTLRTIVPGQRPRLQQVHPDVSRPTVQAIGRAVSRRAEERFSSTAQFQEALAGQALPSAGTTPVIPLTQPLELVPGRQVRTLGELVEMILLGRREQWEAGLGQFLAGKLTTWLNETAASLHEAGQEKAAQEASVAATAGDELRSEVQDASAVRQQAAFFRWLTSTGHAGGQPQLAMGTFHLRLGAVKGKLRMGAIFTVQNKGAGFLLGEVESQVDWLVVREKEFGCRKEEAAQITVELRDHSALSQPVSSAHALRVTSNGGQAWVGASIAAPRPLLGLDQQVIDFGEVYPGQRVRTEVLIRNEGGGVLTGRISSTAPWLRVSSTDFKCPAGSTVPIEVELRADPLPVGTTAQDSALVVDSDYGQARIEARVNRVQPRLELQPEMMDFGTIAPVYRLSQSLHVINSGTGSLEGTVSSQVEWLRVEQAQFRCRPKETALITVWADPTSLPGGETESSQALIIDSNGGYQVLAVRLAVRRPRLHVDRRPLDFGVLLPGQESVLTLSVGNRGVTPLHTELVSRVPWLTVKPAHIACQGGDEVEVELTLRAPVGTQGEVLQVDRALYLASDGGVANLDLQAEIVSPRLAVDPLHLDFGLIGPSDVARGQLRLRNEGSGTLQWHLKGEFTWLEVFPRQGSCAPGQTAVMEVNGFALGLPEGTASAQATVHIESNGGQCDVPVSVAIAAPVLAVVPLVLDLGSTENYAPAEATLRIANHGGGHLRGEVTPQVEWLSAEPGAFDCATGSVAEVRVLASPRDVAEGETAVAEALMVISNGGQETVDVRLDVVLRPILEVAPIELSFRSAGVAVDPDSGEGASMVQALTLSNQGYGALRVRFQPTVPWLTTDRGSSTLRHGRRTRVRVGLDLASWRESEQEGYLEIRAGRDMLASIPVTVIEAGEGESSEDGTPPSPS